MPSLCHVHWSAGPLRSTDALDGASPEEEDADLLAAQMPALTLPADEGSPISPDAPGLAAPQAPPAGSAVSAAALLSAAATKPGPRGPAAEVVSERMRAQRSAVDPAAEPSRWPATSAAGAFAGPVETSTRVALSSLPSSAGVRASPALSGSELRMAVADHRRNRPRELCLISPSKREFNVSV